MSGEATTISATSVVPTTRRRMKLRSLRTPLAIFSLAVIAVLLAAALLAPVLAPYDPFQQDLSATLSTPSAAHWLGTDALGRDILSRLMFGGRISLLAAAEAVIVAVLLGVPAGLLAGYFSGWVDTALARLSDVILSTPGIIVILTVLAVFGPNITAAMITLGILHVPDFLRLVRASTLAAREELYVDAARVAGLAHVRIIVRHILPNITGPVIIRGSMVFGIALLVESGLSFLGLGARPPTPSWGAMVAEAGRSIFIQPWLLVPTGLVITLAVLAFNLLGDALHDASAPGAVSARRIPRAQTAKAVQVAARPASHKLPQGRYGDNELPHAHPAGPDPDALLSVRGLEISFPAEQGMQPVAEDVSFDVASGQTVGLVGESGCGKTVTSLAILGLVPPPGAITAGSIRFAGRELVGLSERELNRVRGSEIGYVSQEPMVSLDPVFTVGDLISEPIRRHRGMNRAQARAATLELLDLVGMPDPRAAAQRYPHQLSGGMAQRVAIAMALGARPKLLIADEPTTALDVTIQAEILDLFRRLQDELSMAVLLVTHDLGVLADFCTSAVVMYAGQVVEQAPVANLLRSPLMPYTDGLLRSDPHRASRGHELYAIPGTVPAPQDWPHGCRFQQRCPLVVDECRVAPVPLATVDTGRASRCVRVDELVEEASS